MCAFVGVREKPQHHAAEVVDSDARRERTRGRIRGFGDSIRCTDAPPRDRSQADLTVAGEVDTGVLFVGGLLAKAAKARHQISLTGGRAAYVIPFLPRPPAAFCHLAVLGPNSQQKIPDVCRSRLPMEICVCGLLTLHISGGASRFSGGRRHRPLV